MSDTEEADKTMIGELERLRKRVNDLEAEVHDLRLNPIGKEKDDWFRKLVEIMNDGVVVLSKDANVTYCNNRVLESIDRSADEVLGRSAFEFIDEDCLDQFGKEFLKRSQSKRGLYEMDLQTRDGRKNPVLCSASPIFDDRGEFQGSLSTLSDTRFLRKAQETIKQERDKFLSLADASPFGLVLVSPDGAFEYMNSRFVEMFGYDYQDIPDGRTWRLKAFPNEDYRRGALNAWVEDLKKADPGAIRARVFKVRCKDGTDKIVHLRPVQLSTSHDLMTCEDITDYSRSESERKRAYSILESALESTADGILIVDRDRDISAYNRKFLEIWRIPEEEASTRQDEGLLDFIIDRLADPDSFLRKVNYLYEHPGEESLDIIQFADGRIIERYSKPQRIDGEIIGRVWSFRDVSLRIELEKELAEAIEELKAANRGTNALLSSARTVLESDNFRHAAQFILNSAQELTSAEAGHITVMDPEGKEQYLLCFGASGLTCGLDLNQPIPVTGLHQYVYDKKRAVFRNDLSKAGNALVLPEGHVPLDNILLAPLVFRNRTFGFLALGNKPGGFTDADKKHAEAFAELAAIGLLNRQMARQLEQSEERYRMIFAHSPLGIAHFDQEGAIVDCNDQFEEIMGASYRKGPPFNMLKTLEDPKMMEAMKTSVAGKIGYYEGDYLSVRGQKLTPMRAIFSSVKSENGNFLGGVGIFEDITELKAAEKTLLQAERVKAVAGLAGGVAHNFNNLLQIIMGNVELSLMDIEAGRSPNLEVSLRQIKDTVRLGAETVRRLQTFAKVRQEDGQEDYKVFDISDAMSRALETSEPSWKGVSGKKGADITVEQNLEKGLMIRGREDEILEVLINLITNAAEACPNGGEVRLSCYSQGGNVVAKVSDNGIGIADGDLKRLFDPFWTARKTNIGTGLGLALSRSIVIAHGGSIKAASKVGAGTTFTVTLPLVKGLGSDLEQPEQSAIGFAMTVLVIDDMEPIVEMLAEVMTQMGHTVFTAISGSDGVEIFKQNKIDVVICDLVMPGMDGWKVGQAIASICAERGEPKTRFILLTGWGGQTMEEELIRRSGVDALLEKPIDMKKLLNTMGKLSVQTTI
jgi:PAS domain S-box-containing protein